MGNAQWAHKAVFRLTEGVMCGFATTGYGEVLEGTGSGRADEGTGVGRGRLAKGEDDFGGEDCGRCWRGGGRWSLSLLGSSITKTGGFDFVGDKHSAGTSGSSESVLDGLEKPSSGTTIIGMSALILAIIGVLPDCLAIFVGESSGDTIAGMEGGPCWERGNEYRLCFPLRADSEGAFFPTAKHSGKGIDFSSTSWISLGFQPDWKLTIGLPGLSLTAVG